MAAADRPIRILMTTDCVGGVWSHSVELAGALAARGIAVELASMGGEPNPAQRRQVRELPGVRLHARPLRLEWMAEPWDDVREAVGWLRGLAAAHAVDLVHLNQFAFGAIDFGVPKLLVAHSCVLSWWRAVHGEAAPATTARYRDLVAAGLAGADRVAAPTAAMFANLSLEYGFAQPPCVLPNGRSARDYKPAPRKQPFVLCAGRLWDAGKNLSALEAVAPELPWPVVVAGATAQPTGGVRAPRQVRALGELPPPALAETFGRAAIYALPARYEPFGQSALEAGLAGCALVLGDLPTLREVWGDAARFVAPDDTAALRDALQELITSPQLRHRMGRRARERALRFTTSRMVEAYLDTYAQLVRPALAARLADLLLDRSPHRPSSQEPACAS